MFVGHSAIGFAAGALIAWLVTRDSRFAFKVAVIAAVFGMVPDVDVLTGLVNSIVVIFTNPESIWSISNSFWEGANSSHRAATHSLLIAGVTGILAYIASRWSVVVGVVGFGVASVAGFFVTDLLNASMLVVFFGVSVAVAYVYARETSLTPEWVGAGAFIGLFLHPFGDLMTGEVPQFLFPVMSIEFHRIAPAVDPTINLVLAGLFEVVALWIGVVAFALLSSYSFKQSFSVYGSAGMAMVFAPFVLQPPTMAVSYHFVLPIVGLALLASVVAALDGEGDRSESLLRGSVTGLTALSLAFGSYLVVYSGLLFIV